jgi:hypothetical protein
MMNSWIGQPREVLIPAVVAAKRSSLSPARVEMLIICHIEEGQGGSGIRVSDLCPQEGEAVSLAEIKRLVVRYRRACGRPPLMDGGLQALDVAKQAKVFELLEAYEVTRHEEAWFCTECKPKLVLHPCTEHPGSGRHGHRSGRVLLNFCVVEEGEGEGL